MVATEETQLIPLEQLLLQIFAQQRCMLELVSQVDQLKELHLRKLMVPIWVVEKLVVIRLLVIILDTLNLLLLVKEAQWLAKAVLLRSKLPWLHRQELFHQHHSDQELVLWAELQTVTAKLLRLVLQHNGANLQLIWKERVQLIEPHLEKSSLELVYNKNCKCSISVAIIKFSITLVKSIEPLWTTSSTLPSSARQFNKICF